jgi:phosphoribosylglycinamide formyltransferase-1
MQAFIDSASNGSLKANIAAVISNRPNALGLEKAACAGINTEVLDHKAFDDRNQFDTELMQCIDQYSPDLVILAGFMRILTVDFVRHYHGRLLNIHPSLLPKYPGLNTHQRAIDAGDNKTGATVHFVTEELDGGPAIIQASVEINDQDTATSLAEKTLIVEHKIYPLAAQWFADQRLKLEGDRALLDEKQLPSTGYLYSN